jgi:imidazolonepropionase-like amidohydrolase
VDIVIGGEGKFLIPGLADMHVHLQEDMAPLVNAAMLKLFVAHGITTVRNMFGTPDHLLLRKRIENGTLMGPRLVTTGPALDGRPTRLLSITARSKASFRLHPLSNFSRTWGFCFSLKANPSRINKPGFVTVVPRSLPPRLR